MTTTVRAGKGYILASVARYPGINDGYPYPVIYTHDDSCGASVYHNEASATFAWTALPDATSIVAEIRCGQGVRADVYASGRIIETVPPEGCRSLTTHDLYKAATPPGGDDPTANRNISGAPIFSVVEKVAE